MALTGAGFDGTLTEGAWARLAGPEGIPDQSVPGASTTDFALTLSGSALTASVAAGTYNRHGILATSDAAATVTFTNPGSGSRYDCVALLLNWAMNMVTLTVVQGGTTPVVPWASMQKTIGTQVHVPLELVRLTAGQTKPVSQIDLRLGRGWQNATMGSGFTVPTLGDRVQYKIATGNVVEIRGAVEWASGSAFGTSIVTGLPVPADWPWDYQVATAYVSSGGSAGVQLTTAGALKLDTLFQHGTWTVGNAIRIHGGYAL